MPKKKDIPKKIRLRFPPSPTGPAHIGTARTILFNYLFAKKNGGEIVLRIEDTDKERSKLEWVQNIIDELTWLGITWDEGPDIGGPFGPYKQSQRIDIYKKYLEKLLADKKAYYCFCTPEVLEAKRQDQASRGLAPKYDGTCRDLSDTELKKNFSEEKKSVIRFRVERKKVVFHDLIRGDLEFDMGLLGDIVIAKSLEEPLYHFAVVVDDYEMQISHVIRGEDHISNTPRQILLQKALGFDQPFYAHIPLLLNADKSKMSKRAGDVAVQDYHQAGYLPEALINFMALLGWNPGTEKEIFSMKELIEEFSLEKIQRGGAVFNVQRLDFINSIYIKEKPTEILTKLCIPYFPGSAEKFPPKTLEKIVELHKIRIKKLSDITDLTDFFFKENLEFDREMFKWKQMAEDDIKKSLETSAKTIEETTTWNTESLQEVLLKTAEEFNKKHSYPEKDRGYLLWPLRVALSGKSASAGPFEIADILGKKKTLQRIKDALLMIS